MPTDVLPVITGPQNSNSTLCTTRTHFKTENAFPAAVASFIQEVSQATSAPSDFARVAVLVMAAAAIGAARLIRVNDSYCEFPILFAVLVAEPGSGKSPACRFITKPLVDEQNRLFAKFEAGKLAGDNPPRLLTNDSSISALFGMLATNPKGIFTNVDEFASLLDRTRRYPTERTRWLELFDARSFTIDRKREVVHLRRPHTTILGTIQPDKLRSLLAKGDIDGFAERLLFCYPRQQPLAGAPRNSVSSERQAEWNRIVSRLRGLRFAEPGPADDDEQSVEVEEIEDGEVLAFDRPDDDSEPADETSIEDGELDDGELEVEAVHAVHWPFDDTEPSDEQSIEVEGFEDRELGNEEEYAFDTDGEGEPICLELDEDAREILFDFMDELAADAAHPNAPDGLRRVQPKAKIYVSRLTLILALLEWASGDDEEDLQTIGVPAVEAAIYLTRYFISQWIAIHQHVHRSENVDKVDRLVLWMKSSGLARCTAREAARTGICSITDGASAVALFEAAAERGLGRLEAIASKKGQGGRRKTHPDFVLLDNGDGDGDDGDGDDGDGEPPELPRRRSQFSKRPSLAEAT